MTLRLALGAGVVATTDGTPSVIVGLIIPVDEDLLFDTNRTITLAAKLAYALGKRGEAVVVFNGFAHLDPGDDFDPETPNTPGDLEP